jgi:hypothetical protein
LYSVVGTCKHLAIDPFAFVREALPALFALENTAGEEALAYWLPDKWQLRQESFGDTTAIELTAVVPA